MASNALTLAKTVLANLARPEDVRQRASELGVVDRQAKVDAYNLVMVLILGLVARQDASVAQLGRVYNEASGTTLARSSFWARLTPEVADLLRWLLNLLLERARAQPVPLKGVLSPFREVVAVDATVVKVHDSLAGVFPGTRRNSAKAALKVHTTSRVLTGEPLRIDVTAETCSDAKAFRVPPDVRNTLILADRAYSSPTLWKQIDDQGGYFLMRVPKGWNLIVAKENQRHRGRARQLIGRNLRDELSTLRRAVIDVDVIFRCRVRKYGDAPARKVDRIFRVVAVRNDKGGYNVYATNARPNKLRAGAIAKVYRLRWEVETLFKAAKTGLHLRPPKTSRKGATLAFLFGSLIRVSLAMQCRRFALGRPGIPAARTVNLLQWARWWKRQQHELLAKLVGRPAQDLSDVLRQLYDPNLKRGTLRASFAAGLE